MLSYALGGVRTKKILIGEEKDPEIREDEAAIKERKRYSYRWGTGEATKDREIAVSRELQKYQSQVNQTLVNRLVRVLADNNLNIRMLVAADYWFRGNENPKIFTQDMYLTSNLSFNNMSRTSFPDKNLKWDQDSLIALTSYAHFLRENVYRETDDIVVITDSSDDDNYGGAYNYDGDDD